MPELMHVFEGELLILTGTAVLVAVSPSWLDTPVDQAQVGTARPATAPCRLWLTYGLVNMQIDCGTTRHLLPPGLYQRNPAVPELGESACAGLRVSLAS